MQMKARFNKGAPYRIRNRMGTSFGHPVHISFYLNPVLDGEGKTDRKKIVELFNTESYG
jgi:DNA polymerase III sliding clamp (beta) subunit (PCNA family)